ncbi:MAG: ABC transporter substrate-binding protein [Nocardiopsaceae bacterium]|nr:ABC transporter substrate-binding protein [Nocardiopsaceae bacterium]
MRGKVIPVCATGLIVTAAAVSSCGTPHSPAASGAGKTASITIGLPTSTPSFANSDVAVAQAEGFFKKEGLNVNVESLSSGVPVVQGVVGGSLDIGASSTEPVVNAAAAGAPVQIIGSYANKLTVDMVTPSGITAPAQLRGKRLGIQQVGAFREVMTRIVLEKAGMTQSDVSYVPGSASGYIGALVQGTIQSGVLQEEQVLQVLDTDSKLHVLVNFAKSFPDYFYGGYVVSKSWLAGNESVAERFLAAITMAHRFMYKHKAATVPIVAKNTGFSASVISRAYDVLVAQEGVFPVNSGLDTSRITDTINTMKKYHILTGTAPAESSLVNTGPITAALAKLGGAP